MRILIGDEEVSFSSDELMQMYVGAGAEGEVFRYGDKALKIYREKCFKRRLEEDTASKLIGIPTKRILLPRELIRDPDSLKFMGYETPFIRGCSKYSILDMPMKNFLDEVSILEDDIELLSSKNVELADFSRDNFLYNGSFYFCDPGSYRFNEDALKGNMYSYNIQRFSGFVLGGLIGYFWDVNGNKLGEYLNSYEWDERLSLQIKENALPEESLKQIR